VIVRPDPLSDAFGELSKGIARFGHQKTGNLRENRALLFGRPVQPLGGFCSRLKAMKLAGLFLSVAGFFLAVAALVLLQTLGLRYVFVLCGFVLQCGGIAMLLRSHMGRVRESRG
jgi:hypothetical protein